MRGLTTELTTSLRFIAILTCAMGFHVAALSPERFESAATVSRRERAIGRVVVVIAAFFG